MGKTNYSSVEGMIDNIVEVVQRMFFYYVTDSNTIDDLKQEGYVIAYDLLARGEYDPNKSLRNYLFTGVRNAMTNYMYRINRAKNYISTDDLESAEWQYINSIYNDSFFDGKAFIHLENLVEYKFTEKDLKDVTQMYTNFGDMLYEEMLRELHNILDIQTDVCIENKKRTYPRVIKNAIMGEMVWRKLG